MIATLDNFASASAREPGDWLMVTCVDREAGAKTHAVRVRYIGGRDLRGRGWRIATDEAIRRILAGQCTFYVISGGVRVRLTVRTGADGSKCLCTELDDGDASTLLRLPSCENGSRDA